jgi:aminopeptidase N
MFLHHARIFLLAVLTAGLVGFTDAYGDPPNDGIDVQHYVFSLQLEDQTDVIRGEASVMVHFTDSGLRAIELDLVGQSGGNGTGMQVKEVRVGPEPVPFVHEDDRLQIKLDQPSVAGEERTVTVVYEGVPADGLIISTNKYGDRTFFGDNWPNRARHWLPTVDHPSDKATVEFVVTAPDHYEIVSNGMLVSDVDVPGPLRVTHWRTTAPIPTKVMVIGVADFEIEKAGVYEGIPVESWVYPEDREKGFFDFKIAPEIVAYFSEWLGPYPFEKLANVQSTTRYGGMENAGAIFYHENAVTGTRQNERLLAHEIAHQWFGNAVTEEDWHHLWLSEGFATYLTDLYTEAKHGREAMKAFMAKEKDQVLAFHKSRPNAAIVDTTVTDPNELLNANSYQKGAWVLHMLRYTVGDEAFREGLKRFYETYRNGNAVTDDFQRIMEEVSGQNLGWFFEQWVYQPGFPVLDVTWTYDKSAKTLTVVVEQVQKGKEALRLPLELLIEKAGKGGDRLELLQIDDREEHFTIQLDEEPAAVVVDPNAWLLMEYSIRKR